MGLPVRDQLKYWSIAAAIFFVVLYLLGNVILPFILGGAIAYLLDPVADRLERMGFSRGLAVGVITIGALLVFVIMALLVVPTLTQQSVQLFNTAPQLARDLQTFLSQHFPSVFDTNSVLHQTLQSLGETVRSKGGALLETVLSSAVSFLNVIVILVVVPVVTVYLLYDWDRMVGKVDALLPRDHAPVIRKLAHEIDTVLASFIRGMGTVCIILGLYYAVALMLVGLQFGLVVGAIAGLITFIPYVGSLVGGALAIGLGLFQFWGDWTTIGLIAAIFLSGQFIEGNFLTPRLVGSSVGLHPVWLIFALSVFGTLFGFVGMLVAVPLAAAIGVVTRFVANQYHDSRLYQGVSGRPPKPPASGDASQ